MLSLMLLSCACRTHIAASTGHLLRRLKPKVCGQNGCRAVSNSGSGSQVHQHSRLFLSKRRRVTADSTSPQTESAAVR